ncbi:MAG TPA: Trm112 family protein [Candidatus Krumholzibacteria bacterium]|nr:Trm112 family protein [Candidatus Krumholzibacteria bacterium]HRX51656.1 Trm112 family protein [Candidatus Krumholzibacteria bacterium]
MDAKLLEILVCPACKGPLTVLDDHSALDCAACALRYKVEDGIPIMLVDEAERLNGGEART